MEEIEHSTYFEYNDFECNMKLIHSKHKIFEVRTEQKDD